MNKTLILVIVAECWMTMGQICFKKSANRINIEKTNPKAWIIRLLESILSYPILWLGAISMALGLFFWISALANGTLNYVCLLGSTEYILALFASYFFLHEKIDTYKWVGTLLITAGVILTIIS